MTNQAEPPASPEPKSASRKKWIQTIIGGLILACVANAIWEIALRPFLFFCWKILGIIVTLGMGDESLTFTTVRSSDFYCTITVVMSLTFFAMFSLMSMQINGILWNVRGADRKKARIALTITLGFVMSISAVIAGHLYWRISGIDIKNNYERALIIAAPHLSPQERLEYDAQFLQVQNQGEVDIIMAGLKKAADSPATQPATAATSQK